MNALGHHEEQFSKVINMKCTKDPNSRIEDWRSERIERYRSCPALPVRCPATRPMSSIVNYHTGCVQSCKSYTIWSTIVLIQTRVLNSSRESGHTAQAALSGLGDSNPAPQSEYTEILAVTYFKNLDNPRTSSKMFCHGIRAIKPLCFWEHLD